MLCEKHADKADCMDFPQINAHTEISIDADNKPIKKSATAT
jgi:hypothetical protein